MLVRAICTRVHYFGLICKRIAIIGIITIGVINICIISLIIRVELNEKHSNINSCTHRNTLAIVSSKLFLHTRGFCSVVPVYRKLHEIQMCRIKLFRQIIVEKLNTVFLKCTIVGQLTWLDTVYLHFRPHVK